MHRTNQLSSLRIREEFVCVGDAAGAGKRHEKTNFRSLPAATDDAKRRDDHEGQVTKAVVEQVHGLLCLLLGCICMTNRAAEHLVGSKLELLKLKMEVRTAVRMQSAVDSGTDVHRALLSWASITSTAGGVLRGCKLSDVTGYGIHSNQVEISRGGGVMIRDTDGEVQNREG
jgi:hypothetical protein